MNWHGKRGVRNNNPGNIDFNESNFERDPWIGEIGLEHHDTPRFTVFDTAEHGIRALCKVLLTYYRRRTASDGSRIDTIQEIIDRWAPPIENDTDAYVAHIRGAMGLEVGEIVNVEDRETLAQIATWIIMHENGGNEYDQTTIQRGADMALERIPT
jgi:hypothetical protein